MKRPFLRSNQNKPAYLLSSRRLLNKPSRGLPDAGVEDMCVSGLFLAFFFNLGLCHGQSYAFKQLKDGKAIPQRVKNIENKHASH